MPSTRTGNFPIGFRRGWGDWQRGSVAGLARWAKEAGFSHLDLGWATAVDIRSLHDAGLKLGSCDLLDFQNLLATDSGKRRELRERNLAYVKETASAGCRIFFTVIVPKDLTRSRAENYRDALDAYAPICQAIADAGAVLVIEGSPGRWPHHSNLCCTPETIRAFLRDIQLPAVGINYDPSHLIRLGIDPLRFLQEFAPHVYHVHAKDTLLLPDAAYEYGAHQPAAFAEPHRWGGHAWRYTLPGRGQTPWADVLAVLRESHYRGVISVELEDEDFTGDEAREKAGLTESLAFLRRV
jgi:sugar phosphate isomerase/epimerase